MEAENTGIGDFLFTYLAQWRPGAARSEEMRRLLDRAVAASSNWHRHNGPEGT